MKYPHKESAILEFKRNLPNKKQTMVKTIIGFSNTYGGQIIVGVEDSGKIVGVPENEIDQLMDDLTRSIYDSIAPTIFTSIFTKRFGDKLVVIIDVAEGMNKPYHFSAERISNSTFVRLGAHTMLATSDLIHQLQWQKQHKFLDEIPIYTADEDDIDIPAFENFLKERKQKNNDANTNEMLHHYGILTKDRGRVHPTVGGLLLFAKVPEKFFPEAFVICTHFSGTSGRDAMATRDCNGTLIQQYKDMLGFILSRLNRSYKISGIGEREEQLEIPPEAIREVVLNAIVHRNYLISGATKVSIYDDRLEIFSPGNFPGPIMADKVDIGVTYIRNTIITRVFRDIGIIEKLGSGFITLFESYAKRQLPKPVVTEGVGFVKCILARPLPQANKDSDTEVELVLQMFLKQDEIKAQDVVTALSISRATASRLLTKLVEKGYLLRVGKGAATRYRKIT